MQQWILLPPNAGHLVLHFYIVGAAGQQQLVAIRPQMDFFAHFWLDGGPASAQLTAST